VSSILHSPQSVLVVDDDLGTSECFRAIFHYAGYNASVVYTGRDALEVIRSETPSLVVLDIGLPDITGLDVLRSARKTSCQSAFVMVTGFGTPRAAVESMKLGACDYLEKPLDEQALLKVAEATVGRPGDAVVPHAAERLAQLVRGALRARQDPTTLTLWGREVAVSLGAVRNHCYTARISPKSALRFTRVFRAVVLQSPSRSAEDLLNVTDLRTLRKLLQLGDPLAQLCDTLPPTIDEFILRQRWITDVQTLAVILKTVGAS
jgi:DNA-binding response OmpR family regulator